MKCKQYSEITVEIRTKLKTVKITSNIFAVWQQTVFIFSDGLASHKGELSVAATFVRRQSFNAQLKLST